MKHTQGLWHSGYTRPEDVGEPHVYANSGPRSYVCICSTERHTERAFADMELIALARTAPHECANPMCPGNVNRLKLGVFDDLLAACIEAANAIVMAGNHGRLDSGTSPGTWSKPYRDAYENLQAAIAKAKPST